MASLLPQHDGLLPYYLLWVSIHTTSPIVSRKTLHLSTHKIHHLTLQASVSALIHSTACYLAPTTTSMRLFSGPSAPPSKPHLLARTYGMKNIYTGLIRGYAAYHISNPQVYELAALTFVGVLVFNSLEVLVFRTERPREFAWPLVMAGVGVGWMWVQRGF